MAKFFSGYAQERGFKPISLPRRHRSDEQYVRSVQQARQLDKNNATTIHQQLQDQFALDQNARQQFQDLETRGADLERKAKKQQFDYEIANAEAKAKDRVDLLKGLASISGTAAETLVKEKEKNNKAALQLSQNLVLQYGLNAEEVQQLQAMEGGLLDYEAQNAPLITRLRQEGVSESDIGVLMKSSGWNAYGAALGVVQNAGRNYDFYLTSKQNEDVRINGVDMSLASAEAQGDVAAIAGIFDRHRMNYLQEYLPGYDAAFIAKHAREPMQQAESRRKRSMSTRMETVAREGNYAKEKANLLTAVRQDLTNPQAYVDYIEMRAGGWDSPLIGTTGNRIHKQTVELLETGILDPRYGESILSATVKAKHLGGREVPFREAFPIKTQEIKQAIQEADDERLRIRTNALKEEKLRGQQMTELIIAEFLQNRETMTTEAIEAAQNEIISTGYLEGANRLARLLPYSTEKTNDKEFDSYWTKQKALGIYPTAEEIIFGGLSDNKITLELQQRKSFTDTGLTDFVLENIDKRIKSLLTQQLGEAYGSTQRILPESYYAAFNAAKSQVMMDFRVAYKGPKTSVDAEQYAIGELKKEIQKDDGLYKVNEPGETTKTDKRGRSVPTFDPGFSKFMGISPTKKESSLPAIVDAHKNGVQAFRTQLFLDTGRVKSLAGRLNSGKKISIPSEYHNIMKASDGNISDIILSQHELARKEDPTIPELRPEVKAMFEDSEKIIPPHVLREVQRYNSFPRVDRALTQSNIPSIYDRDRPYVSAGRMIESTGKMSPNILPTFLAIGRAEGAWDPTADTKKKLDPNELNERSLGWFQINWHAHGTALTQMGFVKEDLYNPVKNVEAAMYVYQDRVQYWINKGLPREEAEIRGLEPWSAYTNGAYRQFLPEAINSWTQYKQQASLPVWQQACNMNAAAQKWCADNPGRWN